jgi:23S rRNA (adenine-N6)-dimethyltransferase
MRIDQYSQHFLRSPRLALELIGHTNIRPRDTVIDIGAGSGVITSALARRASKVIAIELDSVAASKLRQNTAKLPNVEVVQSDFFDYHLPAAPYKVCSNIPFNLSSQILSRLAFSSNPPKSIYLIVQRQFARKLLADKNLSGARPDRHFTSALGISIAPLYAARIRRPLRRTDFTPPPAVDTVFLELKLRESPLIPPDKIPAFATTVTAAFDRPADYSKLTATLPQFSALKPSELSIAEWLDLFAQNPPKNTTQNT